MKIKTDELISPALDWAVAIAEGKDLKPGFYLQDELAYPSGIYEPTEDWSQGGPIIEREIGNLWKHNKLNPADADVWTAAAYHKTPGGTCVYHEDGPTPLIAAMRCYVVSKLGDTVDVPEELLK